MVLQLGFSASLLAGRIAESPLTLAHLLCLVWVVGVESEFSDQL